VGLLDDAIREHLELKKAHGASAEEIDHLAQEALGPARREADANGEEPVAESAEVEEVAEPVAEEPLADVLSPEPVAGPLEDAPEPEPDPEPDAEPVIPTAAELTDEELDAEPEAEPDAEELEGEDVLEETPEFLQETPEHDRLWFEQKPPRDFDFDR